MRKFLLTLFCIFSFIHANSAVDWQTILDQAIVINRKSHEDQYEVVSKLMENAGFTNIQRFEAIEEEDSKENKTPYPNFFLRNETASHLAIWKDFAENDSDREYLFICEDDTIPHTDFSTLFPIYWEATPDQFDIIAVGNSFRNRKNQTDLVVKLPSRDTYAYIITKQGAKKLSNLFENGNHYHFSSLLGMMMKKDQIDYYCYNGAHYPDPQYNAKLLKKLFTGICFRKMPSFPEFNPAPPESDPVEND